MRVNQCELPTNAREGLDHYHYGTNAMLKSHNNLYHTPLLTSAKLHLLSLFSHFEMSEYQHFYLECDHSQLNHVSVCLAVGVESSISVSGSKLNFRILWSRAIGLTSLDGACFGSIMNLPEKRFASDGPVSS